jgi:hypothetical protein
MEKPFSYIAAMRHHFPASSLESPEARSNEAGRL